MESKTYHHINAYKFVAEPMGAVGHFPAVNWTTAQLSSLAHSLMALLAAVPLIVSSWNTVDGYLDSLLGGFDASFPNLAAFSFVASYNSLVAQVSTQWQAVVAHSAELQAQVIGYLNPVLKVTNDYYEYIIDLVLPYETAIETEFANEYQRGVGLVMETYRRITSVATRVSTIPTHVSDVYTNESKETKSTTEAVTKTTHKLSMEAYSQIKPALDRFVGTKENVEIISIEELKINSTGVEVH